MHTISTILAHPLLANRASFAVTVTPPGGKLDAWIDFNRNGVFDHPLEHLGGGASIDAHAGLNIVPFTVPAGAQPGDTFARFRLSSAGGLLPTGYAPDGEVEDYRVTIVDGNSPVGVGAEVVAPIAGHTYVETVGSEILVRYETTELFRSSTSKLLGLSLLCNDAHDTIHLANLGGFANKILVSGGFGGGDMLKLDGEGHALQPPQLPLWGTHEFETIDIRGSGANSITLTASHVLNMSTTSDMLRIIADADDSLHFDAGWRITGTRNDPGGFVRIAEKDGVTLELIGPRDWTNPLQALDVNGNGTIEPLDALIVINELNLITSRVLVK